MHGELIALDLETTGVDIETDSIIEFGGVRFKDGNILEEISILINPKFEISPEVSYITGIENEDLKGQPTLDKVLPQISAFIGDAPIIGHNVNFDTGFLRRFNAIGDNRSFDTYDLAAILVPNAVRYSLSNLTEFLSIPLENAHRALDDSRATIFLYWELWQRALNLPVNLMEEIVQSASLLDWESVLFFQAAIAEKQDESATPLIFDFHQKQTKAFTALSAEQSAKLTTINVEAILQEISQQEVVKTNWQHAPNITKFTQIIRDSLQENHHALVEIEQDDITTITYLLSATLNALQNNQPVVISQHQHELRDTILNKYVPLIEQTLDIPIQVTHLSEKSHYLCPERFDILRKRPATSLEELRTQARILVWMFQGATGLKSDITLQGSIEDATWNRFTAQQEDCTEQRCDALHNGKCPLHQIRQQAKQSQLVIADHTLLIPDAKATDSVLPPYQKIIVDEAHRLEESVTISLSTQITNTIIRIHLEKLGNTNYGLLVDIQRELGELTESKTQKRLIAYIGDVIEAVRAMNIHIKRLFRAIDALLHEIETQSGEDLKPTIVMDREYRNFMSFKQIIAVWTDLSEYFTVIKNAMTQIAKALEKLDLPEHRFATSIRSVGKTLTEIEKTLNTFIFEPDPQTICWISPAYGREETSLNIAPFSIGQAIEKHIWHGKQSAVLLSDTLLTMQQIDYIQDRLYANKTPFTNLHQESNYEESILFSLPKNVPEPFEDDYQNIIERSLIELASIIEGRIFVQFNGTYQLKETAGNITPRLTLGNYATFDEFSGTSRETIIEQFLSHEKALLFGKRGLWQNSLLPTESIDAFVMMRLPFISPIETVNTIRSKSYENAFLQYVLPETVLRFRQIVEKFQRVHTRKSVFMVLDSRVVRKRYGSHFMETLPNATIQRKSVAALPYILRDWVNGEKMEE